MLVDLVGSVGDNTDRLNVQTITTLTDNQWNNVAFTYDGSSLASGVKIYFNGVSQSFTTNYDTLNTTIQSGAVANIGYSSVAGSNIFNGLIDEFRVYNRVLSAGEILEQYLAAKRE